MPESDIPLDLTRLEEQIDREKRRLRERLSRMSESTSPSEPGARLHRAFVAAFGDGTSGKGSSPV